MGIMIVTLNPNDKYGTSVVLSSDNLTATTKSPSASDYATIRATHGKKTGKWYWEIQHISGTLHLLIGVANLNFDLSSNARSTSGSALNTRSYNYNAIKFPENTTYGTAFTTGFTIGVALDLDNGTLGFYKDGVFQGVSHTNVSVLGEVYPFVSDGGSTDKTWKINFGATSFKYAVPNGYTPYSYEIIDKFLISSGDKYYSMKPKFFASGTAIPKMTNNTSPSGKSFASSFFNSDSWNAFNQVDDTQGYVSGANSFNNGFVGYEFDRMIILYKYLLRSGTNTSTLNAMPKNWTFEGSIDGDNWIVLDTQVNQSWTSATMDKEYTISNRQEYKMYRLKWTANNGHVQYVNINEFRMFEYTPPELKTVESKSEYVFTEHGVSKDESVELYSEIDTINHVKQTSESLGSGRVFKQKIDRSKHRAKKIILG